MKYVKNYLLQILFLEEKIEPIEKVYLVNSLICCIKVFDNFLWTGCDDNILKVWTINIKLEI